MSSSQLKNILHFTAGGPTSLPHNLNWNGRPVRPDHIELSTNESGTFVTADETNVTISISVDVDILVESWHTIERTFGNRNLEELVPQPFVVGQAAPTPAFTAAKIFIYARATGSDTTGDGKTIATAYRTWQRAIRDVPLQTAPGVLYFVDCTDLGPEVLPANFALPAWKSPLGWTADFSEPIFNLQTAVNMIATPRLVASLGANATINPGDIVAVTQNPISGNVAIQTNKVFPVPVGTPPVGGLVGKVLLSAGGAFDSCVIYDNTVDTIFLTLDFPPTAPLQIMEQSAELITSYNQDGFFAGGLVVANVDSCSFQGFDIHPATVGNSEPGLAQYGGTCWLIGCNLRAPRFTNPARQANIAWTNIDGDIDGSGFSPTFWDAALYHGSCRLVNLTNQGGNYYGQWATQSFIYGGTVYESCDTISPSGEPYILLIDVLIRNATGVGVNCSGGFAELINLAFENCASNAISITNAGRAAFYVQVGGTGWVGDALDVQRGSIVTLRPFGSPGSFAGVGDSMKVGDLPSRTFADFRVPATGGFVMQQYDITAFNATPATFGVAGTGSHVLEIP